MNDRPETTVGYVSPLKKICMTIGELPTSYIETMSYYEMLIWFTEFLKNQVIPTVNNNAEAVKELQTLYEDLRTYVNDSFDNLNLQEEVDNTLNKWLNDGTLYDLINTSLKIKFFMIPLKSENVDYLSDFIGGIITENKTLIVDTGRSARWQEIKTQLDNLGITDIDYLFITHYHDDHIQNLSSLLSNYGHDNIQVYIPKLPDNVSDINFDPTSNYNNVLTILSNYNITPIIETEGYEFDVDTQVKAKMNNCSETIWENYYPESGEAIYNNFSSILNVSYGNSNILFTGDIEYKAQEQLVDLVPEKPIVVTAPHHGANPNTYKDFIMKIYGENYVFSSLNRKYPFTNTCDFIIQNMLNCYSYGSDVNGNASDLYYALVDMNNIVKVHGNACFPVPYSNIKSSSYSAFALPNQEFFKEDISLITASSNNTDITEAIRNLLPGDSINTLINTNEGNEDFWDSLIDLFPQVPNLTNIVASVKVHHYDTSIWDIDIDTTGYQIHQRYGGTYPSFTLRTSRFDFHYLGDMYDIIKNYLNTSPPNVQCFITLNGGDNTTSNGTKFEFNLTNTQTTDIFVRGIYANKERFFRLNLTDETFAMLPIDGSLISLTSYLNDLFNNSIFFGKNLQTHNIFTGQTVHAEIDSLPNTTYHGFQRIGQSGVTLLLIGETGGIYMVAFTGRNTKSVTTLVSA